MPSRPLVVLAAFTACLALPALGAMKLGNFTESGALLVADTFDSEVIHKSNFSTDDLQRMARQIDTLQRQLEEQRRALDDLKRSR